MTTDKTGGAAFPVKQTVACEYDGHNNSQKEVFTSGMILLDYFAAKALAALITAQPKVCSDNPEITCAAAYEFAEKMIAERAK